MEKPQVPALEIVTTYTVVENGQTAYFDNGTRFSLFKFSLTTSEEEFAKLRKHYPFNQIKILCSPQEDVLQFEYSTQNPLQVPEDISSAYELCALRWNEFKKEVQSNMVLMIAKANPKFKFPKEVKAGNAKAKKRCCFVLAFCSDSGTVLGFVVVKRDVLIFGQEKDARKVLRELPIPANSNVVTTIYADPYCQFLKVKKLPESKASSSGVQKTSEMRRKKKQIIKDTSLSVTTEQLQQLMPHLQSIPNYVTTPNSATPSPQQHHQPIAYIQTPVYAYSPTQVPPQHAYYLAQQGYAYVLHNQAPVLSFVQQPQMGELPPASIYAPTTTYAHYNPLNATNPSEEEIFTADILPASPKADTVMTDVEFTALLNDICELEPVNVKQEDIAVTEAASTVVPTQASDVFMELAEYESVKMEENEADDEEAETAQPVSLKKKSMRRSLASDTHDPAESKQRSKSPSQQAVTTSSNIRPSSPASYKESFTLSSILPQAPAFLVKALPPPPPALLPFLPPAPPGLGPRYLIEKNAAPALPSPSRAANGPPPPPPAHAAQSVSLQSQQQSMQPMAQNEPSSPTSVLFSSYANIKQKNVDEKKRIRSSSLSSIFFKKQADKSATNTTSSVAVTKSQKTVEAINKPSRAQFIQALLSQADEEIYSILDEQEHVLDVKLEGDDVVIALDNQTTPSFSIVASGFVDYSLLVEKPTERSLLSIAQPLLFNDKKNVTIDANQKYSVNVTVKRHLEQQIMARHKSSGWTSTGQIVMSVVLILQRRDADENEDPVLFTKRFLVDAPEEAEEEILSHHVDQLATMVQAITV